MKVEIAVNPEETRQISFQAPFPKTTKCCRCRGEARLAFVAHETEEATIQQGGRYVSQLYGTTGKEGGLWVHDAMVCALYLCSDCLEATAIVNQA